MITASCPQRRTSMPESTVRRGPARFIALAVAGVLAAATVQVVSSAPALAATGDVQVAVVANNGATLGHAIRFFNSSWTPMGDVEGQSGELTSVGDVASAVTFGELHLFAVRRTDFHLYHTVRRIHGNWTPWEDVTVRAGGPARTRVVSAASVANSGDVHIVIGDGDGVVRHAILFGNGEWQPFQNIAQVGAGSVSFVNDVTAVTAGGVVHVVVATLDGKTFHTQRAPATGTWRTFLDLQLNAFAPFNVSKVSAARSGSNIQVYAVTSNGRLWLGTRTGTGAWQTFQDINAPTGVPGLVRDVAAAGTPLNDVHVIISQSDGSLFHTIKFPTGGNNNWTGFRDVKAVTGDPGPVMFVSIAAE